MSRKRRRPNAAAQLDRMIDPSEAPQIEIVDEDGEDAFHGAQIPAFEIEIVDSDSDSVEEPERRQEPEEDPIAALKTAYAERTREVEDLRARNQDAERRASEHGQQALDNEKNYRTATLAAVDNAITLAKTNVQTAQQVMARAAAEGNWDLHAQANTVVSENVAQIQSLQRSRNDVENAPIQTQIRRPAADDFEGQISGFSPRVQSWLREHKSDIHNNPKNAKMAEAAYNLAAAKGIPVETDAFFAFVDEQMGYSAVTTTPKPNTPTPRAQTPSAPPSRSTFGNPASGAKNRVQLTKEQRAAAILLRSDLPEAEALAVYAQGVLDINSKKSNLLWSRDKYKGGVGV